MSTIKDVARRAAVSPSTVSNVLSGRKYVSPDLRERVLAAVSDLDYQVNATAQSLRTQRSMSVGMHVPDITNPFFNGMVRAVEDAAYRSGYQVVLVNSGEDPALEEERMPHLLSRAIDGLIMVPTRDTISRLDLIQRTGLPCVIVDRGQENEEFDFIGIDNRRAAREATQHLIDLGHRRISVVLTSRELGNIRARCEGYEECLRLNGLPVNPEHIIVAGHSARTAHREVLRLLNSSDRPTAFLSATNLATLGVLRAIRESGVRFPEAVSLLGFDDLEWTRVINPTITVMEQPIAAMGTLAWGTLESRINGATDPPRRHLLNANLTVRASTVPLELVD